MAIVFFDTETSDYTDKRTADDPLVVVPVQIAAILESTEGRVVTTLSTVFRRTGWGVRPEVKIAERVVSIHGITHEIADYYGEDPTSTLLHFTRMVERCNLVVGHNVPFDIAVITLALRTCGLPHIVWPEHFCTMRESTDIVRMPHPSKPGLKWPKLGEVYLHFEKRELAGAHDALQDTYATRRIYRRILAHREAVTPPVP
jgi:DNA polymerase-3 subunit epsilon